jgi:hypothetical protein
MKRTFVYATLFICGSAVATACGGSSDAKKTTSPEGGTGKGTGGGSSAGGASNAGVTGSGGGPITGCDMSTCTGKKVYGITLDACCLTATSCGVSTPQYMNGQCLDPSAIANLPMNAPEGGVIMSETIVPDPTCTGLPTPDGGSLPGCCDKTNFCGIAFSQRGLTLCLTPSDLAAFRMRGGGGSVDAGPETACVYPKN